MYGRGAGDMKGGVAVMVHTIMALRDLEYVPSGGGAMISMVVEEECTGNSAPVIDPSSTAPGNDSVGVKLGGRQS
jgi:acetylornithine deacetylase/succinyl-diaminopimelate desuccinylase-like protein